MYITPYIYNSLNIFYLSPHACNYANLLHVLYLFKASFCPFSCSEFSPLVSIFNTRLLCPNSVTHTFFWPYSSPFFINSTTFLGKFSSLTQLLQELDHNTFIMKNVKISINAHPGLIFNRTILL